MLHETTTLSYSNRSSKREWARLVRSFVWMELRPLAEHYYDFEVLGSMWEEGHPVALVHLSKVYMSCLLYLSEHAWVHDLDEIHHVIIAGMMHALDTKPEKFELELDDALSIAEVFRSIDAQDDNGSAWGGLIPPTLP